MAESVVCESKKHPCADCQFCQWCGDDRCRLCRCAEKVVRKLSVAEQIALYEEMNRRGKGCCGKEE